ncbi:MAG: glycosyltransferase [Bryobacteraceae bacterium]|jgi:hypothetical protein
MSPLSPPDGLIVCFGRNVGELCTRAVPLAAESCSGLKLQFVMSDWLAEDQVRAALVYWVMDAAAELKDIEIALRWGVPLLVPEQSQVLRRACVEGNCGLFYENQEEAIACVNYLVHNPAARAALGENARRFAKPDSPLVGSPAMAGGR